MSAKTQIVQLHVEVSVEVGLIGDTHALLDTSVYTLPVQDNTKKSVLKQTRQLVEVEDLEQTIQNHIKDPLTSTETRKKSRQLGYVITQELDVDYCSISRARIADGIAVDHNGTPLSTDRIIADGLFDNLAKNLDGKVPLPHKIYMNGITFLHEAYTLNETWLDVDRAANALHAISGIQTVVDANTTPYGPYKALQITVDTSVHKEAIETAIREYHRYEADETVQNFESQSIHSLTFKAVIKPIIAPFLHRPTSE